MHCVFNIGYCKHVLLHGTCTSKYTQQIILVGSFIDLKMCEEIPSQAKTSYIISFLMFVQFV